MTGLITASYRRLKRKLIEVAPLVVGAMLLAGVLSAVMLVAEPWLPATYRALLADIGQGDISAAHVTLRSLVEANGAGSVVLFMVAQFTQVLVAPIPGQLLGLIGGTLFGFLPGLFYSTVALAVGSLVAMGSTRLLGEQVLRRFVPQSILTKFDHLVGANGLWSFFLIFLLPVFPDDAICFMAGLTRIPLHRLMLVCVLGRLPGIAVLTFAGAAGADGASTLSAVVLGVAMVLAFILWLWSDEAETWLHRAVAGRRRAARGNASKRSVFNHVR